MGISSNSRAIDGTHVPILKPKERVSDYYNRKGYCLIVTQAVVYIEFLLMLTSAGLERQVIVIISKHWLSNIVIFTYSRCMMLECFLRRNSEVLQPGWSRHMNGVEGPLIILGDPAYPLLPWIMKSCFRPFERKVALFVKRLDSYLANVPNIIASCIVLHNICETGGDQCSHEWIVEQHASSTFATTTAVVHGSAAAIRDAIRDELQ